ncbi:MAG: TolC family protein [Oligoflexales bacterium]|nr:TolC family protein [Oligoflexales bacterium]
MLKLKRYFFTKKYFFFFIISLFPFSNPSQASSTAVNLEDALSAAIKKSETISSQEELIIQAESHYKQALSAVLPSVTALATYSHLARSPNDLNPRSQPLLKINLTQPLFRGFQELAMIEQKKILKKAQEKSKKLAIKLLFQDVLQNYFLILSLEKELLNMANELRNYDKRIRELSYRVKIGRSRQTEILSMQSSVANTKAQMAQIEGSLKIAREIFHFLTAYPSDQSLVKENLIVKLGPVESYLEHIQTRPEIQAALLKVSAASENSKAVERAVYPTLDFIGNYYAYREGVLKNTPWDVSISLTAPLYDGGLLRSKISESHSQAKQASLALEQVQRSAEQEIRSLHQTVQSDLLRVQELSNRRDLAEKNMKMLHKEYLVGLASNMEVLQAMSEHDAAIRSLDNVKISGYRDYMGLTVAAEQNEILNGTH